MLREIYCRNETDPGFVPDVYETDNALEALLTKIRMIIFTNPGEVLGDAGLGLGLESKLFELSFNGGQVQQEFYNQLSNYVPEASFYNVTIEVNFVKGTVRDIAYIDIYVNNNKYLGVVAS